MPHGVNGNLISNAERTPNKVKENASKAGKASKARQREKKERREIFRDVLEGRYTDKKSGETVTGEELLIKGIAVNLSNPQGKNWLGTAKMVVEAMGYGTSPEMKKKIDAEIAKIKAETELTKAKTDAIKVVGLDEADIIDDPLSASLREEAERMNNAQ